MTTGTLYRLHTAIEKIRESGAGDILRGPGTIRLLQRDDEKRYRMIACGALIPGSGRKSDLYDPQRLVEILTVFERERALAHLAEQQAA